MGNSTHADDATDAVRATAQQDGMVGEKPVAAASPRKAKLGRDYEHGVNLFRSTAFQPYERKPDDPLYRPLQIYAADPVRSGYEGTGIVVPVPYEPLEPGPAGTLLVVNDSDTDGRAFPGVDLEDQRILLTQGRRPSPADVLFHQQMVYAVCSDVIASFRVALGRDLSWGFRSSGAKKERLRLRPHFENVRNACYHKESGELRFGYFAADDRPGRGVLPHGQIYTCLSHDVIAHEMAHALLDGMRAHFDQPSNPDVLAFHEAFADLIAILRHFSHRNAVCEAIARGNGQLTDSMMFAVAEQFGQATGHQGPLRVALKGTSTAEEPAAGEEGDEQEPHDRGLKLVEAVVEALLRVYQRRAEPVKTLHALSAVAGAGVHPACRELLAELAAKTASQFLALCIRAIDYCPPVDITFGEYLRALITADHDLVADDRFRFRQELIAAFGRRQIFPEDVADLSELSLLWKGPGRPLPEIPGLSLAELGLPSDPGQSPLRDEIEREAKALADLVTDPRYREEFGLVMADGFALPVIESIRILRRVGPDREIQFGLVAEVSQQGKMRVDGKDTNAIGGATVIFGGRGDVRYVIRKAVDHEDRARRTRAFRASPDGEKQWKAVAAGKTWATICAAGRQ